MNIDKSSPSDYSELIVVWEESVRATHDFLNEEHISSLKLLILQDYFDAVNLRVAKDDNNRIIGFIGVAETNIEMLFIAPELRVSGIGSMLLKNAIQHQAARKVDVNEQNPDAVGFYQHHGFKVVGRSALDGQNNPFPLLHMELGDIE